MKKTLRIVSAVALVGVTAALTSCSNDEKAATQTPDMTFETYTAASTYALKGSARDFGQDKDVVCSDAVSLVMPVKLNDADVTALRDSIMMLALHNANADVNTAINTWLTTCAKNSGYPTGPSDVSREAAEGFSNVKGYIVNLTTDMLVYCVTTDTYSPHAANGMTDNDYINFSLTDGNVLALNDIFTSDGLKQLPGAIARQAGEMPAYAGQVDITSLPANGNFYLSSEGEIVFSYAPTEVGPHALGTVDVPFYPAELLAFLTPRAIELFGLTDLR